MTTGGERGPAGEIAAFLAAAGIPDAAFDARCLTEDFAPEMAWAAARERAAGRPLQYILGRWDFLRLTLAVGEGVLIPRPETELLCEVAADFCARGGFSRVRALDLCAGSGCVGLGVASLLPAGFDYAATMLEYSEEALVYLRRNMAAYPQYRAEAARADVLTDAARFPGEYELITANPPYVASGELAGLQPEVRREPEMALDGGADGLRFYRCVAAAWAPKLTAGGLCAVEVGAGQADGVAEMFTAAGLTAVRTYLDAAGIARVVCGLKGTE